MIALSAGVPACGVFAKRAVVCLFMRLVNGSFQSVLTCGDVHRQERWKEASRASYATPQSAGERSDRRPSLSPGLRAPKRRST
jgi:hypothetical protein